MREYKIQTVADTLGMLRCVANNPAGASELARVLNISKNKAFRIAEAISDAGFFSKDNSGVYHATAKTICLGDNTVRSFAMRMKNQLYEFADGLDKASNSPRSWHPE